jgi:hypothetical protein
MTTINPAASKSAPNACRQTANSETISDEEELCPPSFVIRPLSELQKERDQQDAVRDLREFQQTLRDEPSGALVIRDAGGVGPEVIPEWLRWAVGRKPKAWFIVDNDEGALLPESDREGWDWGRADENAVGLGRANHCWWNCTIFTTPDTVARWRVWIAYHNRDAWVYLIRPGAPLVLQEGTRPASSGKAAGGAA